MVLQPDFYNIEAAKCLLLLAIELVAVGGGLSVILPKGMPSAKRVVVVLLYNCSAAVGYGPYTAQMVPVVVVDCLGTSA